jgi:hypothetical protein
MVSGYLEINIDLSMFKEDNTTVNTAELMDIFWRIMDQMPAQHGRVPDDDSEAKAYWKIKPYLNRENF